MLNVALATLCFSASVALTVATVFGIWWAVRYRRNALAWDAQMAEDAQDQLGNMLPMSPAEVAAWTQEDDDG